MTQITSTKKIVAGLLSLAIVLTAVVVPAAQADAQTTVSFARDLTVGSRGTDVTALQSVLAEKGYLSVAPTGYFGALTKAALSAWQASVGISPASGYFGPITRAYLATNGTGGGVSTVPGCTAGSMYSSTTGAPCKTTGSTVPGCTTGAMYSSTTGQPCSGTPSTGGALDNTDGSITAASSTVVPSTTTIKKGETKDLIAEKFTATAGKVSVNRFDVLFSERPWLTFNKFELVDANTGSIVATKNVSTASDFTEVTVGSSYLLRFDGLNYVVTPGTDQTLKVRGTLLATTDKVTGQNVTVTLPTNGVRTVNGKGYTDTTGPSPALTATITLSSADSTGTVTARLNANALPARIVTTSSTGQTNGVELLKFDLKSENQNATINTLNFTASTSPSGITQVLKSVRLTDGSVTYYASTIGSTTIFTNLNIALTKDTYKALTVVGDVADQNEFSTSTIFALGVQPGTTGVDANYNSITTISGSASSSVITLQDVAITVSAVSLSSFTTERSTTANSASGTFNFTLANNSTSDIYVSRTASTLIATSSTGGTAASSTSLGTVTASGSYGSESGQSYYIIPSGVSRAFSIPASMDNLSGTSGFKLLKVDSIRFDDDTTGLQEFTISTGLENLKLEASM